MTLNALPLRPLPGLMLLLLLSSCEGLNTFEPEVEPPVLPPSGAESVSLAIGTPVLVSLGETTQVEVRTPSGEALDPRAFHWSSSDPQVVTVEAGVVTALENGVAAVSAELDGVSGQVSVEVAQTAATLALSDTLYSIPGAGKSLGLSFEARDARGNPVPAAQLTWTSSAPQRIGVSGGGVVSAPGFGQARVSVTAGDLTDEARVRVVGGDAPKVQSVEAALTTVGTETEPSYVVIRIAASDGERDLSRAEVAILDGGDGIIASTVQPGTFGETNFMLDVHARRTGKARKVRVELTDDAGNRTTQTAKVELQPAPSAPLLEAVRIERVGSDSVQAGFDVTDLERDVTVAWLVGLREDGTVAQLWSFLVPDVGSDSWTGEVAVGGAGVDRVTTFAVVLLDRAGNLSRLLSEAGGAAATAVPTAFGSTLAAAAAARPSPHGSETAPIEVSERGR